MRVDLANPDINVLQRAEEVIRSGGVVLYPADTVYGLGCDPFQPKAVRRLFEVKGRAESKGVLLLIPSMAWVVRLASSVPVECEEMIRSFWPGPLTVLLRARPGVPKALTGSSGVIGLRWPRSVFLQEWMERLNGPLVSTSANLSGQPYQGEIEALEQVFQSKVDLFLECGLLERAKPSTVVDYTVSPERVIRAGELASEIESFRSGNCKPRLKQMEFKTPKLKRSE